MDGANWHPGQGGGHGVVANAAGVDPTAAAPSRGDWRSQLQAEARSRIVNKIMETLKKHLPVTAPEGLTELQKIAVRFEEKIYALAANQSDYLRKISLKMLSMESQTKSQQCPGNDQVIPSQNPPVADLRGHVGVAPSPVSSRCIGARAMVMEVSTPVAKKRRMETLDDRETGGALRLTSDELQQPPEHAPHSEAACEQDGEDQQPLPGAGGDEEAGIDLISCLPNEILCMIISLLPTKDGACTRALARHWSHLWLSAPLNLDHGDLPKDEDVLVSVISSILAVHPGPTRRLSVPSLLLSRCPEIVDSWLQSSKLNNLQELEFAPSRWLPISEVSLPDSAFRCSATLSLFTISMCSLPDGMVQNSCFPQLRHLALDHTQISESSLNSMIVGCPVLEDLLLHRCRGFSCLRVNSKSLKRICINSGKVIVEDAPLLERLLQSERYKLLDISVISAPKLEMLGFLYDIWDIDAATNQMELRLFSFTAVVSSVKILAINMYDLNLDRVINLMRCFPCLEKLYIKSSAAKHNNLWRRKHRDLIRSLDIRLRTVVMRNYRGTRSHASFATFFILNAKLLELMRFEGFRFYDKDFVDKQRQLLQLEKRASAAAQFRFTRGRIDCHNLPQTMHIRDLSMPDPFDCSC